MIKPGDWVMSYSPGIWQVYRVLQYTARDPATDKDIDQTMVFSKRFISRSGKVSFGEECCALSLVAPLEPEVLRELKSLIANDPGTFERFERYEPKDISVIYNARITVPKGMTAEALERLIPREKLLRDREIEALLRKIGVWDISGFATAQFESTNFTCRDERLVYTFKRIVTYGGQFGL